MKKISFAFIGLIFSVMLAAQDDSFFSEKNFATRLFSQVHEVDPRLYQYNIGFYHLNLDMDNQSTAVAGHTLMYLNFQETYEGELVFDLMQCMDVDSVLINGVNTAFTHQDNLLIIPYSPATPFSSDYQVCADIYYSGLPDAGMTCNNYEFLSTNYKITYSLTEPYEAKYWFPCKQVLTDKADSVWVFVTIPNDLLAGSQGLLTNTVDLGNGKKRMEWKSNYPIAYYLISVAIGDYQDYSFYVDLSGYDDSVLVQNYVINNAMYLPANEWFIHQTDTMIDVLSVLLGKFPFHEEKYGHCLVNLGGGMEHQTMTTLGNFGFRLVIHELGHSWFGDYLTCATWQDIWINEGFASYVEYFGEEFIQPDGYEDAWLEEAQNRAKLSPTGSVYVPFNELNDESRIFNYELSYRKGACLVHMIRYMINDDALFFAMLKDYISTFGNSNVTSDDLKNFISDYTGIDFTTFFENWCYGEGYPQYEIEWYQSPNFLHIRSNQTTVMPDATPFFEIPMEYEIVYDSGDRDTVRLEQTQNLQDYSLEVSGLVTEINPDPNNCILKDIISVNHSDIEAYERPLISVSPNPTANFLEITSSGKIASVLVCSSSGTKVISKHVGDFQLRLDVSMLTPGLYSLVLVHENSQTYIRKFVKNN
ncbi:MAG: T9SS type A sorting domain-containing protein [Bacteroidales bacterium]|nr:T9SS type A sorting domain-containing protein [Bacteroidales bacterium]HOY38474.1 M1 family aminopeptidase [Bacteroidales bacterium]HQP04361.1 M1 family aminopeptidase [Bacteroidales bacterium]